MAGRFAFAALVAAAGIFAASGALAEHPTSMPLSGVWHNPKNTVHVEIRACGAGACGYVVWASPKAQADAREGGTKELIGLQLFRNFVQEKSGAWKGKVFVPDLNATFSGKAQLLDPDTLKARGCLIANVVCKSQTWRRVDKAAG